MSISYSTLSQPIYMAAFIYAGIVVGALYSVFRLPRRLVRHRAVAVLCDLLFVAAAALVAMFVLYKMVNITLRLYYFIGMLIGFALYMTAMLPVIRYVNCKLKRRKVDKSKKNGCNNR